MEAFNAACLIDVENVYFQCYLIYTQVASQWFFISTPTVVSFSCQNNGGKTENTGDLSLVVCVCEYKRIE